MDATILEDRGDGAMCAMLACISVARASVFTRPEK